MIVYPQFYEIFQKDSQQIGIDVSGLFLNAFPLLLNRFFIRIACSLVFHFLNLFGLLVVQNDVSFGLAVVLLVVNRFRESFV